MKPNIKDLSFKELAAFLAERKHPAYRARQIWQWLFQKRATVVRRDDQSVAVAARCSWRRHFSISRLQVLRRVEARDGTVKFLFGLDDGESIESVLIPEAHRLTLCISTQAGCGLGCAFCATAVLGPQAQFDRERNRRSGPRSQPRLLARQQRITHIVLMGMGEPLANYAHTVSALEIMTDGEWGLGISPRRVTLSTVGLVPQIEKLMEETRVNLAISLHAPTDELRGELMPVNRKYSLEQLLDCCRALPMPRRKRITFEYVLLRGVNDSEAAGAPARDAAARYPEQSERHSVQSSSRQRVYPADAESEIERFQDVLRDAGVQVNVRRPRGDDIQAACGQLQGEAVGAVARRGASPPRRV